MAFVVAKTAREQRAQLQLCRLVKLTRHARGRWLLQNGTPQRGQRRTQRPEHCLKVGRRGAGLIIRKHRVINVATIGQRLAFLPLEANDLFQHGCKGRVVIRAARLGPLPLRARRDLGDLCRQIGRHLRGTLETASNLAQLRLPNGIQRTGINGRQPLAHLRGCSAGVQHLFQRGHLFAPLRGCSARHHRFLVPAQAARHLPQGLRVMFKRHQVIKGCHHAVPRIEVALG